VPTTVTVQSLPDFASGHLLTAGPHAFVADEPPSAGGNGLGPTPYELLLWSLGACTAMTLLMYARRHEWNLAVVSVSLTHERRHADDCAAAGHDGALIDCIMSEISVRGRLSDEQRERLLEIAGRCPVQRTLADGPNVVDSISVLE